MEQLTEILASGDYAAFVGLFTGLTRYLFPLLALLILLCCGVQAGAWWLAALMVLCTGTVTTGLGILGAYISRIYDETRARPLYIVGETRGFPADFTPFRR